MSSNIASGIVGTGVAGAAAGSVFGPIGTLVGGVGGAIVGGVLGGAQDQAEQDKINQAQDQKNRQQALADKQYALNITAQDQRVQGDDAGQLKILTDALSDTTLSLDDKLALIDGEIAKGLGTDSMKVAAEARTLAVQQFDLYGVGGARDIAKRNLDSQLLTAKENITQAQTNRDVGVSGIGATNAALGVEGATANAQASSAAYGADLSIQQALRQAGYSIDALGAGGGDTAAFDKAVGLSLMGDNTYLLDFQDQVKRTDAAFVNNLNGLGTDATTLINADGTYRASQALSREGAQINFDQMQWAIDQSTKQNANWTLGLVQGLATGIGNAPSYYKGGQGLKQMGVDNKWWAA